jgi:hypothetical protein
MEDLELASNIKNDIDPEGSLIELVNRHSGIFYEIINKLVPKNSDLCSRRDLFDDREIHIYNTALKYNPDKGTKFSTFLGNETKWLCLNAYNKAKRKYMETRPPEELDFLSKSGSHDSIEDVSLLNEIYFLINRHPDPRVATIFRMRYKEGDRHRCLSWNLIGEKVDLSIQGCINIHNQIIEDLKNKTLKKEIS